MAKKLAFDVDSKGPSKISLPLDSEGGIDWDHVRGSVRDAYLNAVSNDVTTLEHIGMAHVTAPGEPTEEELDLGITQEDIHEALDEIMEAESMVFRILAAKFLKHPLARDVKTGKPVPMIINDEIAKKAFVITEKQHKNLDPRVTREVKKIPIPEWMKKHFDLWMIGIMFSKISMTNMKTAMKEQVRFDISQAMKEQARTVANPPHNPQPDSDATPPPPPPINGQPTTVENESLDSEAASSPEVQPSSGISETPLV